MSEAAMTPGPRQTVDRCKHPSLGEGMAVYDHGPAFFLPLLGEPVPMKKIGLGGSQSGPPHYSYLVAVTVAGERIELDTTDRAGGDGHFRRWSPIFGQGWLVQEGWPVYPGNQASAAAKARYEAGLGWARFEPDDGSPAIRWQWRQMAVGRLTGREPPFPKKDAAKSLARLEWDRWTTVGDFEFRDEAPAGAAGVTPEATPSGQMTLGLEGART